MGTNIRTDVTRATGYSWAGVEPKATEVRTGTQQLNPDVKVTVTDPIAPPAMILAQATSSTSRVSQASAVNKPEFTVDLSKYFRHDYLDLNKVQLLLLNQLAIFTQPKYDDINSEKFRLIPHLSLLVNIEHNKKNFLEAEKKVVNSPEIRRAYEHRKAKGIIEIPEKGVITDKLPEWCKEQVALVAKSYVYWHEARKNLEDYGLDTDYLSNLKLVGFTFKNGILHKLDDPEIAIQLTEYDTLLNEYSGVSTIGRLGSNLGIKGVELYELWQALTEAGVVTSYNWQNKTEDGQNSGISNKWLEVGRNVNVRRLVAGLQIHPNLKTKLENYLVSLQKGKAKDSAFIRKYESLKNSYNEKVVKNLISEAVWICEYMYTVYGTDKEVFYNDIWPKIKSWRQEYQGFESLVKINLESLLLCSNPDEISYVFDMLVKALEGEKEAFKKYMLPLGQEVLFLLLNNFDQLPDEDKNNAYYEVKFK